MTAQQEWRIRVSRPVQGGDALSCSCVASPEVQINGIPKPNMSEVASTA